MSRGERCGPRLRWPRIGSGDISAEIALMRVVLAIGDAASVIEWLEAAGEAELLRIARAQRDRLGGVASLVAPG